MPRIWRRWPSSSAKPPPHALDLAVELHAARRSAQRLGEQELIPAIGAVELDLRRIEAALGLAQVGLDAGQQLAALSAALGLRHQPLLELQADVAGRALAPIGLSRWLASAGLARRLPGGG